MKKKYRYPLENDSTGRSFPANGGCGYCGNIDKEEFVCITISAMQRLEGIGSYVPAEVELALDICDHGVTNKTGLQVFRNTRDAYFCSTECLRAFFNKVVDDFESQE